METTVTKEPGMGSLGAGRMAGLAGSVLVVLGALLPWASVLGMSVSGTDGDGMITLVIAVLAGLFLFIKKIPIWIPLILGVVVCGIGGYDMYSMLSSTSGPDMAAAEELLGDLSVSIGIGLYLTILGGLGVIVGSVMEMKK